MDLNFILIVNEFGEFLFSITRGNVSDKTPVKNLCRNLSGKLYGDKGYIGKKLFKELFFKECTAYHKYPIQHEEQIGAPARQANVEEEVYYRDDQRSA